MNDWTDAERRVERAQRFFEMRKWPEALREIRAATQINPYNSVWFFNMGLILEEMGRFDEALDAYRQADQIEPNDLPTMNQMGVALYRTGRLDEAVRTFQNIETLDGSFEPSYCNRIIIYCQRGEHELAEEMFYTARQYKEHCPLCYYYMGCSLEARGLFDKAIWCWTRTLDLHGSPDDIHARIGQAFWRKGDVEEARRHFLSDLRLNPGRTQTMLDLGELLIDMGRLDEAGEKFRRAIELSPNDPGGYYHYGRLLALAQQDEPALAAFATVLRLDPTFGGAHLGMAKIALREGDRAAAAERLKSEVRLGCERPKVLLELANLLMDVGESESARQCLSRLVVIRPEMVAGWLNLAVAQFAQQQYEEGIASCHTALERQPGNVTAMYNIALAHEHLGEFPEALEWIRKARSQDGTDVSLQRLEIRLRVLCLRNHVFGFVRRFLGR